MNRKHTKLSIHYVFDLLALSVAWFVVTAERPVSNPALWLAPVVWIIAGLWTGRLRLRNGQLHKPANLVETVLLYCALNTGAIFLARFEPAVSRMAVLLAIPASLLCVVLGHTSATVLTRWVDRRWPSPERIALLGRWEEGARVANQIRSSGRRVKVTGLILPLRFESSEAGGALPVLGTTASLANVINRKRLDRIIVLNGCATEDEVEECGVVSKRMGVVFSRAMRAPESSVRMELVERFGLPLLDLRPVAFTRRQEILKRCFDAIAASVLLLFAAPAFLVIAAMIKLTSKGPVFYKAPRVGRGGRYFTFLKFRSMYVDGIDRGALSDGKNGHLFKLRKDPRVTSAGRVLRKYSLDELPQLVNVLRGDMSLVGPRPLPAEDLDPDGQSHEFKHWSERRSRVLPGITGLWQIRGRSDVPFEEMIELDIAYIRDWSFALDLRVLLQTPAVVITGKGAY